MGNQTVEALCEKCGQPFAMFLEEMAARNLKVVCPRCAEDDTCNPPVSEAKSA